LFLVEAALSWCVAIGSNIAGITDVITDGITGFLVEQKNARDISNRVIARTRNLELSGQTW